MFPGYSRQFYRPNQQLISRALEKSRKNELSVEDILDDEDLVNDLKSQSFSQLISCINQEKLKKLIDYIAYEPINENDHKLGFKYPFYASEILVSENVFIIDKFFEEEDEGDTRKSFDKDKVESNTGKKNSSIIEINMGEDVNAEAENDEKNNNSKEITNTAKNSKDDQLLSFFNEENNASDSKNKDEIKTNTILNVVSSINENLTQDNKENQEICEDNKSNNEESKSSVIEEKRKLYLNIDYLFRFFSQKGPLNHVLCGYFYKVFNHLSNYKNAYLMRYLMEQRPDMIYNMINHLNRKSICDSIFKVLVSYIPEFCDQEIKKDILNKIIESFKSEDTERGICISELLTEILGNRRIYQLIIKNQDLLVNLHQMVICNINNQSVNKDLIKILIKFNENLLKDVNGIATTSNSAANSDSQYILSNYMMNNMSGQGDEESCVIKSQSNDNFEIFNFSYVFNTISKTIEAVANDFINDTEENLLPSTFSQINKALGLRKITEFEYIFEILEIIINGNSNSLLSQNINLINLIDRIIASKILKKAIQYFFEFPLNNMYQKIFNDTIILIANKYTPDIIVKEIFNDDDFLDKMIDFILNPSNKLIFNSGRSINSGLFAIICELTVSICESENIYIKYIVNNHFRMKKFFKCFSFLIKDKFTKGIQFQQENPFQKQISLEKEKSNESTVKFLLKKNNSSSQSYKDFIEICIDNLSFSNEKRDSIESENKSTSITNESKILLEENSYYDNNYWNMNILEVVLDEII